ncbi:hypothetical protein FMEAI12_3560020 [Parafrankia sp. Ea1.12]|uniref:hypothetical protein n=1 Tax=Parafrankia sp. Ea1.12 TaxID=573499 RepID=UPI000DA54232|nr:hypothetical protein [Parafrankia sp. Ea1.12]SQD96275.1 hypothetical protein FMEAI12_3560020 [Parafrankia sp. Ea1.12]
MTDLKNPAEANHPYVLRALAQIEIALLNRDRGLLERANATLTEHGYRTTPVPDEWDGPAAA